MRNTRGFSLAIVVLVVCCRSLPSFSQGRLSAALLQEIDGQVREAMKKADIPGLSLVMIDSGQPVIRTYGYGNVAARRPVTPRTRFQLASCSKAFTALGVMKLVRQGRIDPDAPVTKYLPWFHPTYKDHPVNITILELLHHTSGIPWQSIGAIPVGDQPGVLEHTIRGLADIRLHHMPGHQYEYATINYDILALIIQKLTRESFETFMDTEVIKPLGLPHTSVGTPVDPGSLAAGYKIGFFQARPYAAPVYRANDAAGYVISDAEDMARWLAFQLGRADTALLPLALRTHQRDETVPLHGMAAYAMGWEVSLSGNGEISHEGLNPNFSCFIACRTAAWKGVVVLANSNSDLTPVIGERVMKLLAGETIGPLPGGTDEMDRVFSLFSIFLLLYWAAALYFAGTIVFGSVKGHRSLQRPAGPALLQFATAVVVLLPFLFGIYLLPKVFGGFDWSTVVVWMPVSFVSSIFLLLGAAGITYLIWLACLFFPENDKLKRVAPGILLMSSLSGIANMGMIILLTSSLNSGVRTRYLIFYFSLSFLLLLAGRSYFQKNLIRFTRGLIYDLRLKLVDRIFSTSFQRFEKMDRGRVYTALNDDVDTIGDSANLLVMLITSLVTALGAFLYLSSIAFWATIVTILLLATLCSLYYFVSKRTNIYYSQARDIRNTFIRLVNGMIDGFKEISLHRTKKLEYKADVASCAREYRDKMSIADFRFVNTSLLSESLAMILLAVVAFIVPLFFRNIGSSTIMSFIVVLLYLGGSINQIVNGVPSILRLKIAWNRINQFLHEIPANLDLAHSPAPIDTAIEHIRAVGVTFRYKGREDQEGFQVGPFDLEVNRGEVVFIIGGNGSGKTTLAKLLVGLYEPDEGMIQINNRKIDAARLGEYFSAAFNPAFLFEKLYDIDVEEKSAEADKYLRMLHLDRKVHIEKNRYSTIDLSGGQRKRLALLQCYLEDSPIYLFDEWAADQDPAYRNFFYRTLLADMRKMGKIVIAITHDDHYFDVADRILKMNDGKLEAYSDNYLFSEP